MKIRYAIISETGRRSNNEDYVKVIDNSEESRWFGAVCDGMGGHAMVKLPVKLFVMRSATIGNVQKTRIRPLKPGEHAALLLPNWMSVHLV